MSFFPTSRLSVAHAATDADYGQSEACASCAAVFLAAPASGQGKTTVTAALARLMSNRGKKVRVFKVGPDYLDPLILQQASGAPVEQLDLWMAGEKYCQRKLYEAAKVSDLIVVEGVMGMLDGTPSSADVAARFGLPILLVMDVKGMAQTAGALAVGLARFRDDVSVCGLIANHCSSQRHEELIRGALPEDLPLFAALPREQSIALPERHLGLVGDIDVRDDLEARFETGAQALAKTDIERHLTALSPISFRAPSTTSPHSRELSGQIDPPSTEKDPTALRSDELPLRSRRIGIAQDAAFSFIYQANLDALHELGAELHFFSPLEDTALPACDALWFPGGYPELYAERLAKNHPLHAAIRQHFHANMPIFAECGGLLYCLQSLTDLEGQTYPMLGLLSGQGGMRGKRGCQGMQTALLPEGEVRAHAHHRSRSSGTPEPIGYGKRQNHSAPGEPIYRVRSLTATYLHLFFPDNPTAIARLFRPVDPATHHPSPNITGTQDA